MQESPTPATARTGFYDVSRFVVKYVPTPRSFAEVDAAVRV
jgi:hypothetical protein